MGHAGENARHGRHTWKMSWDVTVIGAVTTCFLVVYVLNVLVDRSFHTELSPAVAGGLTFEVTAGGPFGYLMAGFVIKALSLGVAIALMWIMLNRIKRGQLYSESTARLAGGTSGAMLAWLLGNFVENMGNNFAASRLGIGDQWSGPLLTNTSVMGIVFLLIAMLYVLQQAIRNALGMQEDIDGLV